MSPAQMDPSQHPAAEATPAAPEPAVPRKPGFGEMAPAFKVASPVNPNFLFRSLGGNWVVMLFFGTLSHAPSRAAHEQVLARRGLFDDRRAQFFGVSYDPADPGERGLKNALPGLRYFWDFDRAVSRLYGTATGDGYAPTVFLLDRNLRVVAVETASRIGVVLDMLDGLLKAEAPDYGAPVLTVPRILEPEFCQALIAHYDTHGGAQSGFMREIDGKTVPILDDRTKKRRDRAITDETLVAGLRVRLTRRLIPTIVEAFVWQATRIERYIVACYDAEDRGFFSRHRDNTTPGTAHRRFAVSINLNDDYDGGDLRFPEFSPRTYRPPVGGATVFACSLLHEATPVTRGRRYATLPFLYDEDGARTRKANLHSLVNHPAEGYRGKD